jgi:hypothetical protein
VGNIGLADPVSKRLKRRANNLEEGKLLICVARQQ